MPAHACTPWPKPSWPAASRVMSKSSARSQRRSSRLAEAYIMRRRAPAGTATPPTSVGSVATRVKQLMGLSRRSTSLKAFFTRSGSRRSRSHWSGWVANSQTALPMALMVVSSDGAR